MCRFNLNARSEPDCFSALTFRQPALTCRPKGPPQGCVTAGVIRGNMLRKVGPECGSRPAARLRLLFREISAELSKLPRPLQKPPLPLLLFFCGRRRVSELIDLLACKVDGLRCGFRASPLHELRSCQPQLDKPTDGLGAVRFVGLPRCPSVHIFTQFGRKPNCRHWVSPSGRPASLFSHYVFA